MPVCTFFGHRDCPETIKPRLREVLVDLITNQSVDMFYVGNQGRFDALVRSVLRELKKETRKSIMPLCWHICPEKRRSTTISPTQCSLRVSRLSTRGLPSLGETIGCLSNPTMWSPTLPILGAAPPSLQRMQCHRGKR